MRYSLHWTDRSWDPRILAETDRGQFFTLDVHSEVENEVLMAVTPCCHFNHMLDREPPYCKLCGRVDYAYGPTGWALRQDERRWTSPEDIDLITIWSAPFHDDLLTARLEATTLTQAFSRLADAYWDWLQEVDELMGQLDSAAEVRAFIDAQWPRERLDDFLP